MSESQTQTDENPEEPSNKAEAENKQAEDGKKRTAREEGLMEELEKQAENHAKEKDELRAKFNNELEEMRKETKKIVDDKGIKYNINPKGSYSDSKTIKAKRIAEEAKKSKSKKD